MITLENDRLEFNFSDVHENAVCGIDFVKTLRVPDDGKHYPLPPGLGQFPLRHLDDYSNHLPSNWQGRGGVITPIHQCEALWLNFSTDYGQNGVEYPFAIKVATGKINAATGEEWRGHLNQSPQDYMVIPEQPWLDGYCVKKGEVRQFVAAPLGKGYTVEEQLSGTGEFGGLQISVCPMKPEYYKRLVERADTPELSCFMSAEAPSEMGLAPGGSIDQEIYEDPYGIGQWDQRNCARIYISLLNSVQWFAATGERPPGETVTANDYTNCGMPWFDYYDADAKALDGAESFSSLSSVREKDFEQHDGIWPKTEVESHPRVIGLGDRTRRKVREAEL